MAPGSHPAGGAAALPTIAVVSDDDQRDARERTAGLAMLGTIFFFVVVGVGVGVFFEQPVIGGIGGGLAGILVGLWLVPGLLSDLD